ncbi:MAG TPA: FAD-binding oxidoreductase [Gaiellaceae bacterium]|nr:FAD-binding oxidoreductase [Gaiellaceae bacterium]
MAGTAATGVLEGEALDELRAGFRGEVLEPDDAEYESACVIFNGMFERRPAVVLRPAGTADVIRAVGLARLSGAELAVRGGGHSVAGFSLCDGGIVVDMRGMRGIRVDPRGRTVRAQAGLDWGQFDRETQAFGLATTGGRVTTTGVTGFTLGSGSGWLERKLGFAADNVVSADVVTADGEVVTATEDENADLLWGLRGGGGNFGIVTELEFRLAPVGPVVYGGLAAFPPEKTVELVRTWRDLSAEADDDLGWAVASITAPPEPFVPEEWRLKRMVGVAGMYAGPPEKAEQVLAPIRALGPVVDLWQPMPYTVVQGLLDPANPYGRRNYWRAFQLRCLDESAIDLFAARADAIPSPFTAFIIMNGGGAIGRVGENDTALGGRSNPFNVHANGMWEGDADEENIAWVRETTAAFAPHVAPGMALNFMTEIGDAELQESWGPKLQRLRELKAKYDPENLFRLNQNVLPAAT